jgi:hypothetical protein
MNKAPLFVNDLNIQNSISQDGLSDSEILNFKNHGWSKVFPFLTKTGVNSLTEIYIENKSKFITPFELSQLALNNHTLNKPWFKSLHAYIPEYYDVVTHPVIVNKVKSLLGANILLWGTSVTSRNPNQSHRWHIDVEHRKWKGVSVFIGLKGANLNATLKVLSESHTFNESPLNVINNDELIIEQSKKFIANPIVESIQIQEGEFFIFDGLLWHGSENTSSNTRYSIIAQYTTVDKEVAVPINYDEPIQWLNSKPPCVLVSGYDSFGINSVITRPTEKLK